MAGFIILAIGIAICLLELATSSVRNAAIAGLALLAVLALRKRR